MNITAKLDSLHQQCPTFKTRDFLNSVQNVVIIASSSRGGSSVFTEVMRRCPTFVHLRAEMNPILHIAGLMYPGSQTGSDALTEKNLTPELRIVLNREMDLECGNPNMGLLSHAEVDDFALAIARRLSLQWPEYNFTYNIIRQCLLSTFVDLKASYGWTQVEVKNLQVFWCVFLIHAHKEYPNINPYYYDLSTELLKEFFSNLLAPEGPPSLFFIEEPPFIIPMPLKPATDEELRQKALVIKTPSNVYRLDFLKSLFPNAKPWILHLTRNAPHSINGLYDGWCHRGFFSHFLPNKLHMDGYSDRFPKWGSSWWNFDLPPGWEDYVSRPLVEVCAFQWYSAHKAICEYQKLHPEIKYLRIRSEDVLSQSKDIRLRTAEKLGNWLSGGGDVSMDSLKKTMLDPIEPVMATSPPQKNRWLEKAELISPVLKNIKIKNMIEELSYSSNDTEVNL